MFNLLSCLKEFWRLLLTKLDDSQDYGKSRVRKMLEIFYSSVNHGIYIYQQLKPKQNEINERAEVALHCPYLNWLVINDHVFFFELSGTRCRVRDLEFLIPIYGHRYDTSRMHVGDFVGKESMGPNPSLCWLQSPNLQEDWAFLSLVIRYEVQTYAC